MERTFRRRVPVRQVVSPELARHLAGLSRKIGRQVGVLLTRKGTVRHVMVGDAAHLEIPEIGRLRGGLGRFRGLRLVHTHLGGEGLSRDDLNDLALLRLDLVAMIEADQDGQPGRVEVAHILPRAQQGEDGSQQPFQRIQARSVHQLDFDFGATIKALEAEFSRLAGKAGKTGRERALVIALTRDDQRLEETLELVGASGVEAASVVRQKRVRLHPRTAVGPGKLGDIVLEAMQQRADVAIFDIDLRPAQARAFEDATGLKAIDRTQLILDIFAQRARSRDGKLQVELAQLKYSLPRLTEKDSGLSRLAGGIGGRGPGETVMEVGRRRISGRIRELEKKIAQLSRQRDLRRQRRRKNRIPVLSIIGYTNAGKTTLLNALTKSAVESADQLFVTLDPTSRRLRFPRQGEVIITDTVGFIRDLPPDLLTAFRATLEELAEADLLLHVADASDPALERKIEAVERILGELKLDEIPLLVVLNKADQADPAALPSLCRRHQGIAISALQRTGLEELISEAKQLCLARQSL